MNLKENERIVWKVVSIETGKYLSAIVKGMSEITIEYKLNEFVKPILPNSKIFVFSNKHRACEFIGGIKYQTVFKCIGRNISYPPLAIAWHDSSDDIKGYWDGVRVGWSDVPTDTLFCDELMLLEKDCYD